MARQFNTLSLIFPAAGRVLSLGSREIRYRLQRWVAGRKGFNLRQSRQIYISQAIWRHLVMFWDRASGLTDTMQSCSALVQDFQVLCILTFNPKFLFRGRIWMHASLCYLDPLLMKFQQSRVPQKASMQVVWTRPHCRTRAGSPNLRQASLYSYLLPLYRDRLKSLSFLKSKSKKSKK